MSAGGPALTSEEKKWLKDHYDSEFKFLQTYGLSIYKEEDREEGRATVRELMEGDDGEQDEDDEDDFMRDLESDPTSHVADYHFSAAELDWNKKYYRHSGNFFHSYMLKPFDDEDCREGISIVRATMREGQ